MCFLDLHTHCFYPSYCILNTFTHTLERSALQKRVNAPSQGLRSSVRAAHLRQHRSEGLGRAASQADGDTPGRYCVFVFCR